jgi:hypothetical protein
VWTPAPSNDPFGGSSGRDQVVQLEDGDLSLHRGADRLECGFENLASVKAVIYYEPDDTIGRRPLR